MRTLKFRCFDNKSNKMIENCSHVQREGIDIMQFTGLLDRHGGFASELVGKDGLTGRDRAKKCGAIGGRKSRRTKVQKQF